MSGGVNDYPEHLNPFKRERGGIRRSFRDFTKKLGKVWKKKDTSEKSDNINGAEITSQRAGLSVTLRNKPRIEYPKTDIYPRSRFSERVGLTQTIPPDFKTDTVNPFEGEKSEEIEEVPSNKKEVETESSNLNEDKQEEENNEKIDIAGENIGTKRRRRRKKRAPLPPGALGNSLGVPELHDSKWSISSYETDCSTYTNHSENEQDISADCENLKDLQKITTDIQKYFNDVEENSQDKLEIEDCDLKFLETSQSVQIKSSSIEDFENTSCKDITDDNNIKDADLNSRNGDIEIEEARLVTKASLAAPEDDLEEDDVLINDALESIDCKEAQIYSDDGIQNVNENEGCDSTLNDSGVMSEDLNYIDGNGNCEISFNEETTIYINNNNEDNAKHINKNDNYKDTDELLEKLAISCERLDDESCENVTNVDHPTPKIRKHKLSRDVLLNNMPK